MKKNEENYLMLTIVKLVAAIFKWVFLVCSVTYIALTVALIIFSIVDYSSMTAELISNLSFLYGAYDVNSITNFISDYGKVKTIVGISAQGFAYSITFVILYNLANIALKFIKNIERNKVFNKENIGYIDDSILLVLLFTFASPVITYIAEATTGVVDYTESYIPCGISIVLLLFVLKMVFENGVILTNEVDQKKREVMDLKANISDEKISKIKEEKKETKKETKEVKPKVRKTTKKATTK